MTTTAKVTDANAVNGGRTSLSRPSTERRASRSRAASLKKALSISTISHRVSQDAPPPAVPSAPLVSPTITPRKSFSLPKRSSVPAQPAHARSPSQYYNDPEARRKLKQYLASPQNFEEALEFGFPSAATAVASGAPQLPEFSDNHVHSFLKDSTFLDDDNYLFRYMLDRHGQDGHNEDDRSDYDSDRASPLTPTDPAQYHAITTDTPQLASPLQCRKTWDGAMFAGQREMTLHLTLTRPEVRGDGQTPRYGVFTRDDPLALDALPTMPDHEAVKGFQSGAAESRKVRGLWRRLMPRK